MTVKTRYVSPLIIIGGDKNKRDIARATRDLPDMKKILAGPTRGKNVLDILSSNFNPLLVEVGVMDPKERKNICVD